MLLASSSMDAAVDGGVNLTVKINHDLYIFVQEQNCPPAYAIRTGPRSSRRPASEEMLADLVKFLRAAPITTEKARVSKSKSPAATAAQKAVVTDAQQCKAEKVPIMPVRARGRAPKRTSQGREDSIPVAPTSAKRSKLAKGLSKTMQAQHPDYLPTQSDLDYLDALETALPRRLQDHPQAYTNDFELPEFPTEDDLAELLLNPKVGQPLPKNSELVRDLYPRYFQSEDTNAGPIAALPAWLKMCPECKCFKLENSKALKKLERKAEWRRVSLNYRICNACGLNWNNDAR